MGWFHALSEEEMEELRREATGIGGNSSKKKSDNCGCSSSNEKITNKETETETATEEESNDNSDGNGSDVDNSISPSLSPHIDTPSSSCPLPLSSLPPAPPPSVEYIYHLCEKEDWDNAKKKSLPYFPPTFLLDGKLTRASMYKNDNELLAIANTYYKTKSEPSTKWIILEINCNQLYSLGIPILVAKTIQPTQQEKEKDVENHDNKNENACLQIHGGISTTMPGLINKIYHIKRNFVDGTFLEIIKSSSTLEVTGVKGDCNTSRNIDNNDSKNRKIKKLKEDLKHVMERLTDTQKKYDNLLSQQEMNKSNKSKKKKGKKFWSKMLS